MQLRLESGSSTIDRFPPPPPQDGYPQYAPDPTLIVPVRISDLVLGHSPRLGGEVAEHVRLLAEAGAALPPILVHRQSMRVIDGLHRVHAARSKGEQTICARFFDGGESAAFVLAVQCNIAHGLPLTTTDRKAAARRIIGTYGHWSDRAIAACTGLSDRTVRALRHSSSAAVDEPPPGSRLGQDGRSRPLSNAAGRIRASEIIAERPATALRQVAATAGVSLGTAHDVRKRMERGADPVPERQRAAAGPEPASAFRRPGRPPGLAQNRDPQVALEFLRADPAVRFTESGRAALRWLCAHAVDARDWEPLVAGVPAHCAPIVAGLARCTAEAWLQLARELELRGGAAD